MADQPCVMVVDDEDPVRSVIKRILRDGYEVIEAVNGRAALELLDKTTPDLILLDLMMPEMGGIEVLKAISGHSDMPPIIVLTGVKDNELVEQAFALGAVDYVTKPFLPTVLIARIRAKLRRFHTDGVKSE